ncbi:MAG: signal peptidase I [Bacteroidia bacterium]|nr:signal peptidase I [Bacteroidia bacterium]
MQASRLRKNLFAAATGAILLYIALRLLVFDIYFIRSTSMRGTLWEGDYVLVNKWFLNTPDRYDITVFEPPLQDSSYGGIDSYIKRCVGLPGDTVLISAGVLKVNNVEPLIPELLFQYHIMTSDQKTTDSLQKTLLIPPSGFVPGSNAFSVFLHAGLADSIRLLPGVLSVEVTLDEKGWFDKNIFPFSSSLNWNLDHFGPIIVPVKGMEVAMNEKNYLLYKAIIQFFEKKDISAKNGKYFIGETECGTYTFENDYYFMMGDNRHASSDSRAWGFVPSDHIRGTTGLILWSVDPVNGSTRDQRRFRLIH